MTQAAFDYIKTIFAHTTNPVHICSFGNERDGKHKPRKIDTRDGGEISAFISKWDQAERGMFYCVSTLNRGAHERGKDTVSELPILFADVDLKDVEESIEEIERKLKLLRYPPSIMVRSGNGVHAIWLLSEFIDISAATGGQEEIESALRLLADVVGGDLQVCEVARVLRLPGSHNTKFGEWKDVVVSHNTDKRYHLDDIQEWLGEQSPVILRKVREHTPTARQAVEADPYLAWFKESGLKPPVDVEKRLDAMMYMGGGDAAVHATQLAVSSSMLNAGSTTEEVVEVLLAATKAAAGDYGKRWNWRIEERSIRKMCESWHKKYTPTGSSRTGPNEEIRSPNLIMGGTPQAPAGQTGGGNVVSLATARVAKPKPKVEQDDATHIKLGQCVIDMIRKRGDDILFTEKAGWRCEGGIWTMATDGMNAWLNVEIETHAKGMGYPSNNKLLSETRNWIQRQPSLWRNKIEWDMHGKVPTRSGLVDPRTLEVEPLFPEHYATWRIEAEFDPDAQCPWWLQMLEDVFADRSPEVREATIRVIQELLGAGLIDEKPREISRALVFQGGSNFGKSGILEVLGGLFGQEQNATPIEALEGAHGMMQFVKRSPWVLHEAFDQRKWHFSSSVKAIVTGELINVNVKNGPLLSIRVRSPIFWGTNHPPQFKEATKAIVNRMVIIECRREFVDTRPVGAAIEARRQGYHKPSTFVLATELPGVLAWALKGLQRALERGYLSLTADMVEANEAMRVESNLVAGFLEECINYDPDRRLSVPDFCLAFAAWWMANKGENRQPPSNDSIGKSMVAMADPMIAMNPKELRDNKRRYYAGITLNEEGLNYHEAGYELRDLQGKVANTTAPKGQVNSMIPAVWDHKTSVYAMRQRHSDTVPGLFGTENAKSQVSPPGDTSKCHGSSSVTPSAHQNNDTISKTTHF